MTEKTVTIHTELDVKIIQMLERQCLAMESIARILNQIYTNHL